MVSFRISVEEFEKLKTTSEAQGASSVSDYARLALGALPSVPEGKLNAEMERLSGEVRQLSHDVHRLTELLEEPERSVRDSL
jgi:hypothetical protein